MPDAPQDRLPIAEQPGRTPKVPTIRAPLGACDAHVHMLAGPEFALDPSRKEDPASVGRYDDWLALFRQHLDTLGCTRTVLVQSILYGADNAVTIETVRRLGDMARAVILVDETISDGSLGHFAKEGVIGARVHVGPRGILDWDGARALAPRLAEHGMHLQVLVDDASRLDAIAQDLVDLPVDVVIDHCGLPAEPSSDAAGMDTLRRALGEGRAWVKLSGLYRFDTKHYEDSDALVASLVSANPERCLWGSDWPHIMLAGRPMPDAGVLLDAFMRQVPNEAHRQAILVDNPARLFGFG